MKQNIFYTSLFSVIMLCTSAKADHLSDHAIEERLATKDHMAIYKKGEEPEQAQTAASEAQVAAADGEINVEQLYQNGCMACHATGAANAPKLGVAADWQERVSKGRDTLISNSINGIGAMPPRGGFNYNDEEMAALVDYMLEKLN